MAVGFAGWMGSARGFPGLILTGAAGGAGAVAGRDRGGLVGEEDAVPDVSAAGDRAQRRPAVEAAVDPLAPVAAPLPLHVRLIRPAVGTEQDIGQEPASPVTSRRARSLRRDRSRRRLQAEQRLLGDGTADVAAWRP